ncbi:MAG: hypothetical protein U9Q29_07655 [Campylobacterota bacterium]|nr:hypothetical protein [Campylobacterota bacterium]
MKIFVSVLLILVLALSLVIGFDEGAMELHDEALERAMVAFGLAKGLNAIISLMQGTELSVFGVNFTIGEVLDPFNDMVERFSWVMLASSVSLGFQKILLLLSSKVFLKVAISLSVALSLFLIWQKQVQNFKPFIFSLRILVLLLVLRFGAIFCVYGSEMFYNSILKPEYINSTKIVKETEVKLKDFQNKIGSSKKENSWYDSLNISAKYKDIKEQLLKEFDSLKSSIEEASKNIINLITIFIVQSVIMPLLFLWFFVVSIKWIFRVEIDDKLVYNLR